MKHLIQKFRKMKVMKIHALALCIAMLGDSLYGVEKVVVETNNGQRFLSQKLSVIQNNDQRIVIDSRVKDKESGIVSGVDGSISVLLDVRSDDNWLITYKNKNRVFFAFLRREGDFWELKYKEILNVSSAHKLEAVVGGNMNIRLVGSSDGEVVFDDTTGKPSLLSLDRKRPLEPQKPQDGPDNLIFEIGDRVKRPAKD